MPSDTKPPNGKPTPDADDQRRADKARPSAGGDASESLRTAENRSGDDQVLGERRDEVARPSEGGGAAESARAGDATANGSDADTRGALGDDQTSSARPSAAP